MDCKRKTIIEPKYAYILKLNQEEFNALDKKLGMGGLEKDKEDNLTERESGLLYNIYDSMGRFTK